MIKAISTALWKILELVFYYLGIVMLDTSCCGVGAKEDPELISFQLTFIPLEYDHCTKLNTPDRLF